MALSIRVEDSTLTKLSPILEKVVLSLNKTATHNDYLIALIIVVMEEVYLFPENINDRGDVITTDFNPIQWKIYGGYHIPLRHKDITQLNCKLDAIPVGDTMILNLSSVDNRYKTRSMAVDTLEYVNLYSSDVSGRFMSLKKFSHKFKDTLTTPIRDEILNDLKVTNPSLTGLPYELKLKIKVNLDKQQRSTYEDILEEC